MILDHRQYKNIDFKKYRRVFIFGCSFTNYHWPTWANIISLECVNSTEIYNFARAGGGNLFIAASVAAANQKYVFTDEDLVLVMWSTHSREDRYRNKEWIIPGNIWTQNIISEDFVKEWACVRGYLVRDLAVMTLTKHSLTSLPCDAIILRSVDPSYDERYILDDTPVDDVINLYRDIIYDTAPPLYQFVKTDQGGWINGHEYWWRDIDRNKKFQDYHPNPKMYMDYLLALDFDLSEKTKSIVDSIYQELRQIDDKNLLTDWNEANLKKYLPQSNNFPYLI